MPEIALTELPTRLQRQADNARVALERGNADYAISICRAILVQQPGCLAVRRLLRVAQIKARSERRGPGAALLAPLQAGVALVRVRTALGRDPTRALDAAEQALGFNPKHVGALRLLARAAQALELAETAVFALEAARERAPANRALLLELAAAWIAVGRPGDALVVAEQLLETKPGDPALQDLIKRASVAQSIAAGRWDVGTGSFRDQLRDAAGAVALEQDGRGNVSAEVSRRQIAEAEARLATEPANLKHYRTLVGAYRALGDLDQAIAWLDRARALPTGAGDAALEKLRSDLELARLEERIHARAVALGSANIEDVQLSQWRRQHAELRLRLAQELVEKYPNEPDFRFELGECCLQAGDEDAAIQHFQAVRRHPKLRIAALRRLGEAFQAKGLHDLAVQQYETAKAELTEFDEQKKEVTYRLAACLEAMGQPERALVEYKLIYSADIGFRDVAGKIARSYTKE